MKFIRLILLCFAISTTYANIQGDWSGSLDLGAMELTLNLHLDDSEGSIEGTFGCVEQDFTLPIEEISYTTSTLSFKIPNLNITYEGTLKDGEIVGTFTQGKDFPLTWKRGIITTSSWKRPQTEGVDPSLYWNEEISIPNGDVTLAGTLTLPKKNGTFPTVIFIAGSGPQNRDETILGHKPFLVIADHLAKHGIASLRLDIRGVGASTGDFSEATCWDFIHDTQAAITYLKTRNEVKTLGLLGHSEGGMIAPEIASSSPDVQFMILLAGTGARGSEVLILQSGLILKAEGTPPELTEAYKRLLNSIIEKVLSDSSPDLNSETLFSEVPEVFEALPSQAQEEWKAQIDQTIEDLKTPWFRTFLTFDPKSALSKVDVPVLALNGSLDLQVCPKQNLYTIEKVLKEGRNPPMKIVELEGLNHLFQVAETGSPTEYAKIEETISPDVLHLISSWILNLE